MQFQPFEAEEEEEEWKSRDITLTMDGQENKSVSNSMSNRISNNFSNQLKYKIDDPKCM